MSNTKEALFTLFFAGIIAMSCYLLGTHRERQHWQQVEEIYQRELLHYVCEYNYCQVENDRLKNIQYVSYWNGIQGRAIGAPVTYDSKVIYQLTTGKPFPIAHHKKKN